MTSSHWRLTVPAVHRYLLPVVHTAGWCLVMSNKGAQCPAVPTTAHCPLVHSAWWCPLMPTAWWCLVPPGATQCCLVSSRDVRCPLLSATAPGTLWYTLVPVIAQRCPVPAGYHHPVLVQFQIINLWKLIELGRK